MSRPAYKQHQALYTITKLTVETQRDLELAVVKHIPLTQALSYQKYKSSSLRREMRVYYDTFKKLSSSAQCTLGNTRRETFAHQNLRQQYSIFESEGNA